MSILEKAGLHSLHVDLVDPHFSPSMPIGLDVVKQLKSRTNMDFDVHIMTDLNEYFIDELVKMHVASITFHAEKELHIEKMLQKIREAGIRAGIALNPATSLQSIEYAAQACDYVLLMLINPGYAGGKSEAMVSYAEKKVRACRDFLDRNHPDAKIIVDGRVGFETIPQLVKAGAEILVGGTSSIFRQGHSYQENVAALHDLIDSI
ncbi:ribulose-phosphate 3-epimerase [Selenomonas sp. TAMA-11512]|nr:ribulose-phosphate 3-epimerase [Selenomonas sp. TAMA-11512]